MVVNLALPKREAKKMTNVGRGNLLGSRQGKRRAQARRPDHGGESGSAETGGQEDDERGAKDGGEAAQGQAELVSRPRGFRASGVRSRRGRLRRRHESPPQARLAQKAKTKKHQLLHLRDASQCPQPGALLRREAPQEDLPRRRRQERRQRRQNHGMPHHARRRTPFLFRRGQRRRREVARLRFRRLLVARTRSGGAATSQQQSRPRQQQQQQQQQQQKETDRRVRRREFQSLADPGKALGKDQSLERGKGAAGGKGAAASTSASSSAAAITEGGQSQQRHSGFQAEKGKAIQGLPKRLGAKMRHRDKRTGGKGQKPGGEGGGGGG